MKKYYHARMECIDVLLDLQDEKLLAERDQCWKGNEHLVTGEELTRLGRV